MKIYHGERTDKQCCNVFVNERPLAPRLDLKNHSPTGFDWSYGEGPPLQLALALLADFLGDDQKALALYHDFHREVVSKLAHQSWTLHGTEISSALCRIMALPAEK